MSRYQRILITALVFFSLGTGMCAAQDTPTFYKGVESFKAGEFGKAAGWFEELIDEGLAGLNLYYNLGNAYYRQGRTGKAIWAYEMARRMKPRDEDVRWNLNLLKKTLVDRQEGRFSPTRLLAEKWLFHVSFEETAFALGCAVVLFLIQSVIAVIIKPRRGLKGLLPASLAFLVITSVVAAAVAFEFRHPRAVIQDTEVYARYGPTREDTKAFLLHEGTTVIVRKSVDEWVFVQFGQRQKGWLPRSSVRIL